MSLKIVTDAIFKKSFVKQRIKIDDPGSTGQGDLWCPGVDRS